MWVKIMNLERLGEDCTRLIKGEAWFPYRHGKLRDEATDGHPYNSTTYEIKFDTTIAPYITYLEEGTKSHDIPGAFGRAFPFGIGGRFNGKFHPGSTKHQGFIGVKSVNAIVNYICSKYNGELK